MKLNSGKLILRAKYFFACLFIVLILFFIVDLQIRSSKIEGLESKLEALDSVESVLDYSIYERVVTAKLKVKNSGTVVVSHISIDSFDKPDEINIREIGGVDITCNKADTGITTRSVPLTSINNKFFKNNPIGNIREMLESYDDLMKAISELPWEIEISFENTGTSVWHCFG